MKQTSIRALGIYWRHRIRFNQNLGSRDFCSKGICSNAICSKVRKADANHFCLILDFGLKKEGKWKIVNKIGVFKTNIISQQMLLEEVLSELILLQQMPL
jgi:hypothetical protein